MTSIVAGEADDTASTKLYYATLARMRDELKAEVAQKFAGLLSQIKAAESRAPPSAW